MQKIAGFSNEKIIDRLLNNKSKKNYWNYITELRKRKDKSVYQKAILFTQSKNNKEIITGVNILAQFGSPRLYQKQTLSVYGNLLQSQKDKQVLSSILYAIGHNNEKLTVKQINQACRFASHKSALVRHSVVFALGGIEHPQAIGVLIELSKDKDPEVRDWATFSLGSRIETDNEPIRQALWEGVTDKDKNTRYEAIFGLAARKDKGIKEVLKKELARANNSSSQILEAIEVYRDPDFIPLVKEKIKTVKPGKGDIKTWLQSTLATLQEV